MLNGSLQAILSVAPAKSILYKVVLINTRSGSIFDKVMRNSPPAPPGHSHLHRCEQHLVIVGRVGYMRKHRGRGQVAFHIRLQLLLSFLPPHNKLARCLILTRSACSCAVLCSLRQRIDPSSLLFARIVSSHNAFYRTQESLEAILAERRHLDFGGTDDGGGARSIVE